MARQSGSRIERLKPSGAAFACGMVIAALQLASCPARADDVADEADFLFQRGAEAYQHGDYATALERFLASNRLVPNRNVRFNVASTYARLGFYPEAFRYFTQVLAEEVEAEPRARIESALAVIRKNIAVLRIETQPSGATLYLDRRDLGARGTSPTELGVAPGSYRVLVELPGHYPAEFQVERAAAGETRSVQVKLVPMRGQLAIDGPRNANVKVVDASVERHCEAPCTLELSAGPHLVRVSLEGYREHEEEVDVPPAGKARLRVALEKLRGRLVVTSDEPGALVEIDDAVAGFTPAVVSLPGGRHRVHLRKVGFREVRREVWVDPIRPATLEVVLNEEEQVSSASRVQERVEDAPSSVSLLSQEEIRAFRYPTLADALRGVPGVYVWDDRSYSAVGMRGIGQLGSYGNRVLVLFDGHPLNDNWVGSSYVGFDGHADLLDLEQIEIVRGPGSVAYGTSAFAGVVNLVHRKAGRHSQITLGLGTNSDGVALGRARAEGPLGKNGGIWASAAVARGGGRDFHFPELASPAPQARDGSVRNRDGFESAGFQGSVQQGPLSVGWYWYTHDKAFPTAAYDTLVGDPRSRQRDTRAALEVRMEPRISKSWKWLSRAHLNRYEFRGNYPLAPADGGLTVDVFRGTWAGVEERLEYRPSARFRWLIGGELQSHFQVEHEALSGLDAKAESAGVQKHSYRVGAGYSSLEWQAKPDLTLYAGARLDVYSTFGSALNPRLAAIYKGLPGYNIKLLSSRAFRAPSVYELYYADGYSQRANPDLGPEHIDALEIEVTRELSPLWNASASGFVNYLTDSIVPRAPENDLL
ncbi:MAG TPA: TonB-dependent receptor, partial [Polyangiaceae bacterium]|nr:TonB-dependent receptor [Polyangiaceae bacterium]